MSFGGYKYYQNRNAGIVLCGVIGLILLRLLWLRLPDSALLSEHFERLVWWVYSARYHITVVILGLLSLSIWANRKTEKIDLHSNLAPKESAATAASSEPPGVHYEYVLDPVGKFNLAKVDPIAFEKIVGHLLRLEGHPCIEMGGRKADGGIDLILDRPDNPGAVQCKKYYSDQISARLMREFIGAMTDNGYRWGFYATIRGYSAAAQELAQRNNIQLWDGDKIQALLSKHEPILSEELQKLLKAFSRHCELCGERMNLQRARKGFYAGQPFWGCSNRSCGNIVDLSSGAGKNKQVV